jgi:hypothetical protein
MAIVTKEEAFELFKSLSVQETRFLVEFMLQNINQFKMSGMIQQVDFPYYFYSIHRNTIFGGEESPDQYLDMKLTSDDCTFLTIYYITKALIRDRGRQK